jgi:hypothetical protein
MYANFLLGTLHVSAAAAVKLKRVPLDLVARHAINEHGRVTALEAKRNEAGMKTLGRIVSRYPVDPTNPKEGSVLVVTRATWDLTTVKLEGEK